MRLYPKDIRRFTYYKDGKVTGVAMKHLPTGTFSGLQPTLDDADRVLREMLAKQEAESKPVLEWIKNLPWFDAPQPEPPKDAA